MRPPRRPGAASGVSTVFAASVPPLVKTTFLALAPTSAATSSRARSTALRAARPSACTEEALPGRASARDIAAATSGRTGVVALWSR